MLWKGFLATLYGMILIVLVPVVVVTRAHVPIIWDVFYGALLLLVEALYIQKRNHKRSAKGQDDFHAGYKHTRKSCVADNYTVQGCPFLGPQLGTDRTNQLLLAQENFGHHKGRRPEELDNRRTSSFSQHPNRGST
jgi:hypothetical protein